jgi:hypothetical protein
MGKGIARSSILRGTVGTVTAQPRRPSGWFRQLYPCLLMEGNRFVHDGLMGEANVIWIVGYIESRVRPLMRRQGVGFMLKEREMD